MPPIAEGRGSSADSYAEANTCVVFVMDTYDGQRTGCIDVLERLQPTVEALKGLMLADQREGCPLMDIEVSTIDTMAETDFYRTLCGWSVSFKCRG